MRDYPCEMRKQQAHLAGRAPGPRKVIQRLHGPLRGESLWGEPEGCSDVWAAGHLLAAGVFGGPSQGLFVIRIQLLCICRCVSVRGRLQVALLLRRAGPGEGWARLHLAVLHGKCPATLITEGQEECETVRTSMQAARPRRAGFRSRKACGEPPGLPRRRRTCGSPGHLNKVQAGPMRDDTIMQPKTVWTFGQTDAGR